MITAGGGTAVAVVGTDAAMSVTSNPKPVIAAPAARVRPTGAWRWRRRISRPPFVLVVAHRRGGGRRGHGDARCHGARVAHRGPGGLQRVRGGRRGGRAGAAGAGEDGGGVATGGSMTSITRRSTMGRSGAHPHRTHLPEPGLASAALNTVVVAPTAAVERGGAARDGRDGGERSAMVHARSSGIGDWRGEGGAHGTECRASNNRVPGQHSAKGACPYGQVRDRAPMRLLIVEDDDAIAAPLARGLEREDFTVTRVTSGAAALAAGGYDLVLLDLGMPDIDGLTICHELRPRSDVPIIVITRAW